ncbi:MAG: SDR family oxidoreductase [Dehalococcoidales bacterium]|jgi:dTDP-4-dehydrorhamnose reductase
MRVLIFGGNGMLGHQLCRLLPKSFEVWATFRNVPKQFDFLPPQQRIGNVTVEDTAQVREILDSVKPDAVVNAVGIVKQRDEAKQAVPSIRVNALFPHQLADLCGERGIRVLQISTDCVFSGFRGAYTEDDIADPVDLYGRTKLLGELNRPGCLTLRTSIIGWQLNTFTSLLSWFALKRGKHIKGYRKAIYSGVSTSVLSVLIGDIIENHADLQGLYHIASTPITKFDLLVRLREALGWDDITIEPEAVFACDRSLSGERISRATGWRAPDWASMISGLSSEWPTYAEFYLQPSS